MRRGSFGPSKKKTRSHQKTVYNLLFRASADALLELASDPRFVGGKIGMVGALHTWTRDLLYHPHVHYIATGGGLSADGQWLSSREDFLVHVGPLSILFRAKFRDLLKKADLFHGVEPSVWNKDWVVHCQPVGTGEAAFKDLAPYIFRVAISNSRILKLEHGEVTFKFKDSATDQVKFSTLTAKEFIRRFLQHVLPNHFVKVRYYGLLSASNRHLLEWVRRLLDVSPTESKISDQSPETESPAPPLRCPKCGSVLIFVQQLKPKIRWPP